MWMEIDSDKIEETLELALTISKEKEITLNRIEVLLGKLQHCIKFCPGGRQFMNRLLDMRRDMSEKGKYELTAGASEDLDWFFKFLRKFNGRAVIRSQFVPTVTLHVDVCLVGAGAVWRDNKFVAYKWPAFVKNWDLKINELELFNIVMILRKWKEQLRGETLNIWCDNNTSVMSLMNRKARNSFMAACLREFLLCEHIAGSDNNEAELLSRAYNSPETWRKYQEF